MRNLFSGLAQTQPQIDKARTALQSLVQKDTTGAVLYRLGGLAALEKKAEEALHYLQEAIFKKGGRFFETAPHDPAWRELRTNSRFQSLVSENTEISSITSH